MQIPNRKLLTEDRLFKIELPETPDVGSSITKTVQTIAASESGTFDVVFAPVSEGSKSANIEIPSNDPVFSTLTIPITATASGGDGGDGTLVASDLWIKAVINTVEKRPVDAVWQIIPTYPCFWPLVPRNGRRASRGRNLWVRVSPSDKRGCG